MKKYLLLLCIGLLGGSCSISAKNCNNDLIVRLLDDLLRNSNLILPRTIDIQARIGDCSLDDAEIISQLDVIESIVEGISVSTSDELVLSQLDVIESIVDLITVCCDANGSQLDVIQSAVENISVSTSDELVLSQLDIIETCCGSNSSQLDVIESLVEGISVSTSDELVLSQLDVIESKVDGVADCCASSSDVLGEITDIGSCLDSQIDVPDDINNLMLTAISLLKTILLEIRGCNIP